MTKNLSQIVEAIKPLSLHEKAELIKMVVDMISQSDDFLDLVKASESSLEFWNNPIDDKVWNDA